MDLYAKPKKCKKGGPTKKLICNVKFYNSACALSDNTIIISIYTIIFFLYNKSYNKIINIII